MNARILLGTLRYYIQITWPGVPMAGATLAGLALGFVLTIRVFQPHSELATGLEVAGVVFVVQAVTFVLAVGASGIAKAHRQADPYRELPDEPAEDPDA
jgi:hypothetical protein